MSRPLVIFHDSCVDGWCAAWIMHRCHGDAELVAANYGQDPPVVDGRDVYVVDFSYPREVMIKMHAESNSMLVLDHHKTSEEECSGLSFCVFDKRQSGCGLAYWWCEQEGLMARLEDDIKTRPVAHGMKTLALYVQDRDLFNFALDASEEINACIRSHKFDLDVWDHLAKRMHVARSSLIPEGEAIQRYRKQIVAQAVKHEHEVMIAGKKVRAALCSTGDIISDVCGELAEGQPFAATYCPTNDDKLLVSLRSDKNGLDVGEIAKSYGGGGHARAAGFKVGHHTITEIDRVVEKN